MMRLALLICDIPIPAVKDAHGTYLDIFRSWLTNSIAVNMPEMEFTLEGYDVVQGEYPKPADLTGEGGFKGILITGSAASSFETKPWIFELHTYVKKLIEQYPEVKIIGICFGHQVIAGALGAPCVRNDEGWEVGTTPVELTNEGRVLFETSSNFLNIQEMHRDHVPDLPKSFELLGSTAISPNQGMILRRTDGDSAGEIQVLTVQGHPEFNPDIVSKIVDAREANGVMDAETVKEGRLRGARHDDGVGPIGKAVWKVLNGMVI